MPQKSRTILQPEYMSRFSCIAGACEDDCCSSGWNVFIDKKTYFAYKSLADAELKTEIGAVLKRYRGKDASERQYARFRMREDTGSCVFLTGEGLCRVQLKLGHKRLCDTCAVYPRVYIMTDGKLERSAAMSCPEAVRVALGNPDGIVFETIEEGPDTGRIPERAASFDSRLTRHAAKPAKFFWEVRLYCLSILQNRIYTMGQRLIIIGMLCQKLDELDREGRVEGIPAMLENFSANVEDGSLKPSLDAVENNFMIQLKFAKKLTDERLGAGLAAGRSQRYAECVKETLAGLNCFTDTPPDDILKKYVENRNTGVAAYMKEKSYVIENFLVNEFFMRLMPFSADTAWESYLHLCVTYGMVKLHINGMAGHHGKLTDEIVFKLIQSFTKIVLHNTKFMPDMVQLIKDSGYDTLAWMAILVND